MKKVAFYMLMLVMSIGCAYAQGKADVGDAPLVIHQAVASCGCTVPEYSQEPIAPGKTGTVKVTYNGTGRYPGHFKKSITLRTNAKTEIMRLFIEGDMTAKDAK